MSAVVKTPTPFVIEQALINALDLLNYDPVTITGQNLQQYSHRSALQAGDIITNRQDYWGYQYFRKQNDIWLLSHDTDELASRVLSSGFNKHYKPVTSFLQELEKEYLIQHQKQLEHLEALEQQRLEEERQARVEATRQKVIAQAKAQGYVIQEKQINGKIQLVCTRSV